MASPARRLRHLATVLRAERTVTAAARRALGVLLAEAARALAAAGYDTSVLDTRLPGWRAAVDKDLVPAIEGVFVDAFNAAARGVIDPAPYATRHLEAVHNRLVGVADEAFDSMRVTLDEGRRAGESIPLLAARVTALLDDGQRWKNRAVTIARTEVISANNAGGYGSARATADLLGEDPSLVVKEWLATLDRSTRESHADADGQQVLGLDSPFDIGGDTLDFAGDPNGSAGEVVNCRCTTLYVYPGDPDYPTDLAGGGTGQGRTRDYAPARLPTGSTFAPNSAPSPPPPVPVDTGPSSAAEHTARTMTAQELQDQATGGSGATRSAARSELKRRGMTAAAGEADPCTCCGGTGEHVCGHECYVCDAGMTREAQTETHGGVGSEGLAVGDPILCAGHHGRPDPDRPEAHDDPPDLFAEGTVPDDTPTAAPMEDPVTVTAPEAEAPADAAPADDAPLTAPTHAGIVVQAADTGRILMLQRALDQDDEPDVLGTWEFPGGGIEDGETPEVAAWREFSEETGLPAPPGEVTGGWVSPNGVYQAFVHTTPTEAGAFPDGLNPDQGVMENPDDPGRRKPDVTAWFTPDQAQGLGSALRPECRETTDWTMLESAATPADEAPTDALAAAAGEPAPVPVDADPIEPGIQMGPDLGDQFYGVCVVEDSQTGDGRVFAPGALSWDGVPFPMPAGWQVQDAPGHDGSVICGRIDTMVRFGNLIGYTGTWDLDGAGWETRRMVDGNFLTGLSVDTDDFAAEVIDHDGNPIDPMFGPMGGETDALLLVTGARIRSWAMCRVPAFVEAFVANGTPPQGWAGERPGAAVVPAEGALPAEDVPTDGLTAPEAEPVIVAALVAAAGRAGNPPASLPAMSDFTDPGLAGPTPVTVDDDGRVYGHIATWGTCHIGLDGCVTPPTSASAYAYFLTGEVETTAGFIPVGQITMGTGHASTSMSARPAAAHYDNTGFAVADVFAGEDEHGIWVAGRLREGVEPRTVSSLRAAGALSGDWRKIGGNLELVAALAVNVPGFPVPRMALSASAGDTTSMVAAGMVRTTARTEAITAGAETLLTYAEVTKRVIATLDRRDRGLAAAARITARQASARRARAASAVARLTGRV